MSRRRLSFTERRRRALALKMRHLDKLETRNTITEPISVAGLSVTAFRGLAQMGIMTADGDNGEALRLALAAHRAKEAESHGGHPAAVSRPGAPPDPALPVEHKPAAGGGGAGRHHLRPAWRRRRRITQPNASRRWRRRPAIPRRHTASARRGGRRKGPAAAPPCRPAAGRERRTPPGSRAGRQHRPPDCPNPHPARQIPRPCSPPSPVRAPAPARVATVRPPAAQARSLPRPP